MNCKCSRLGKDYCEKMCQDYEDPVFGLKIPESARRAKPESPVEAAEGSWASIEDIVFATIKKWHGNGTGACEIVEHLKNNYHLIKKQS